MKNKKVLIILVSIIILLIVAIVVGLLITKKNDKSTGTEWGYTYLEYLQDKISNNEYENAKEGSLEFIQLEENKNPAMILSYENSTDKFMEITVIDENGKTITKKVQAENGEELDMELLYSITNKAYNWYEHEKRKDGSELFIQIEENDIKNSTDPTEDKKHEFTKEEIEEEKQSISKFDEEFIKPEIKENKTDIDLSKEADEKELKDKVMQAVNNYMPQDQIITDELKANVENSLKELENQKGKIENEDDDVLKVGSYTLKYGTYKGTSTFFNGDETTTDTLEFILNKDGTYSYTLNNTGATNGKYTVTSNSLQLTDSPRELSVSENNTLKTTVGNVVVLKYQEENKSASNDKNSSSENNTSTEKNTNETQNKTKDVSLEVAEQVIRDAFNKAKSKSSDGNVTVNDIVENMESGWKLVNVNLSTNSKQPEDGSKVTQSALKIIVNDVKNDNSGLTHLLVLNEATGRQFSVGMKATSDKNLQIPAGTGIIQKSYELED